MGKYIWRKCPADKYRVTEIICVCVCQYTNLNQSKVKGTIEPHLFRHGPVCVDSDLLRLQWR